MDHTWTCHHIEPFEVHDETADVTYSYADEWLVCEQCDSYIATQNVKALALRSAEAHPLRRPGNLRQLFQLMQFVHAQFYRSWKDSHLLFENRACLVKLPQVH